jgi:hypothetical protein
MGIKAVDDCGGYFELSLLPTTGDSIMAQASGIFLASKKYTKKHANQQKALA